MSILFLDLETSGLPQQEILENGRKRFYSYKQTDKFDSSRIVQFSFLRYKKNGSMISMNDHIIKPHDFIISPESIAIHHITQEKALEEGKELSEVIDIFEKELDKSKILVMHNVWFDKTILLSEAHRMGRFELIGKMFDRRYYCTMRETKSLCKLPSQYYNGYKLPKLSELHNHLFKNDPINPNILHNALNDVKITAKCFFMLKKLKFLK